eukprot:3938724-Rhodomonas_salina.2
MNIEEEQEEKRVLAVLDCVEKACPGCEKCQTPLWLANNEHITALLSIKDQLRTEHNRIENIVKKARIAAHKNCNHFFGRSPCCQHCDWCHRCKSRRSEGAQA